MLPATLETGTLRCREIESVSILELFIAFINLHINSKIMVTLMSGRTKPE